MKFQVEIPDEAFWKAAAKAEVFDMKVPEWTAELIINAANTGRLPQSDALVAHWASGATDAEIGRALDMTNAAVADRRRGYGLPANRRYAKGNKA